MDTWLKISESVYNLALAFGAVTAGFGGLKLIDDYIDNRRTKKRIEKYRRWYPRDCIGEEFDLVHKPNARGTIYLLDKHFQTRHWIRSWQTFIDLNFNSSDVEEIEKKLFDSYAEREEIFTRHE